MPTINPRKQAALDMLAVGIKPVRLGSKGEWLKIPIEEDWQTYSVSTNDVERWFAENQQTNIGALGGPNLKHPDRHLVRLDFDYNADLIFPEFESAVGDLHVSKTRQGFHVWFYSPVPLPNKTVAGSWHKNDDGKRKVVKFIEIKANGGQVVAPGSLHPSGFVYQWRNGERWDNIPVLDFEAVSQLIEIARRYDKGAGSKVILPGEKPPTTRRPPYKPPAYLDNDDLRERIRRKFDLLAYAKDHMLYDEEKRQSHNRRVQLGGNGGFFIYDDNSWYCFAEGLGGDCYDLVGWLEFGAGWFTSKAERFRDVLKAAADYVGEKISPEHPLLTGEKSSEDGFINLANPRTKDYWLVLKKSGYQFRMNSLLGRIEVNGEPINTIIESEIRNALFDAGLKSSKRMEDSWIQLAAKQMYHPVQEYLSRLKWDGVDHIAKFAELVTDEFGFFPTALKRWMIGAVSRAIHGTPNIVMVWVGKQSVGKSRLARHLCFDPSYYIETEMNPAKERDMHMRCVSRFVWEWPEAQHIFRNPNYIEPMKGILTNEWLTIRQVWDKYDNDYRNLANHIATLNDDGMGFYTDITGNRRYLTCHLQEVDPHVYEYDIDLLWATAVALLNQGERWQLTQEEQQRRDEINAHYLVESSVEIFFDEQIAIVNDPEPWEFLSLTEILRILQSSGLGSSSPQSHMNEIKRVLKKNGIDPKRGNRPRVPWARTERGNGYLGVVTKRRDLMQTYRADELKKWREFVETGEVKD